MVLEHHPDVGPAQRRAFILGERGNILVPVPNGTGCGFQQTGDDRQQRGFARAAFAEDGAEFPGRELHRQRLYHMNIAVAFRHVIQGDCRHV